MAPNATSLTQREQDEGNPPQKLPCFTLDASGAAGTFSFEGVDVFLDCFLLVFLDVTGSTSTSPASMSAPTALFSDLTQCGPGTRLAPHARVYKAQPEHIDSHSTIYDRRKYPGKRGLLTRGILCVACGI